MSDTLDAQVGGSPVTWNDVTAVILAGGLGTRLRGVVTDRPKCLAPILGRPFLAHQLDWLSATGLTQAALCTGYLAEQVEETIGPRHQGLSIAYSRETTPLGTGGAVRLAADCVKRPFMLVLNGDSFCNADLNDMLAQFQKNELAPTMLLTHVPEIARYGQVACDERNRVTQFLEKGASGAGWINAGVYMLPTTEARTIPPETVFSLERDLFPSLAGRSRLYAHRVHADFIDIGTPESFSMADSFFSHANKLDRLISNEVHQARG